MNPATQDVPSNSADEMALGILVDEVTARLQAKEPVDVEAYVRDHPEYAAQLRQLLPSLYLLADLGDAPAVPVAAGTPRVDAPDDVIGTLGDFRILREVGRGGMGVVYEAEQISLGRQVALKVLPFASTLDAKQLQRFKNEAQAAAHLHHQNIVPVFATGCERAVHFYAMQFIEGQTLARVISDLRLQNADSGKQVDSQGMAPAQTATHNGEPAASDFGPAIGNLKSPMAPTPPVAALSTEKSTAGPAFFRAVATLGTQAAEALDYSHELGIIHRDVKPANLMLDARGKLWITDFGLAHCQSQAGLTMSGDLVGTLRYMSPEQALAKRVLVDHRTDIYSLGATLYEMLSLEPVFAGADRQELLRQIAFQEPKAPRRHNKSIPAELETIVMKALEKNPADRYATAKELAEDLERFGKDEPIRARRPSLKRRLGQWCRRHKPLVAGTGVFVLMAMLLGGVALWSHERRHTATVQAVSKDLEEANIYQEQQRWDLALKALERAAGRLAESGPETLQTQVDKRRRDAALVVRFEDARMKAADVMSDDSSQDKKDFRESDRAYSAAFMEFGPGVTTSSAQQIARQIQRSAIRTHIVAALDDWAFARDSLSKGTGESLRAIARLADNDIWRQKLRDQWVASNREALEGLAQDEGALSQPPTNLLILHSLLRKAKAKQAGMALLRRAQERYPADFWLNLYLGIHLLDARTAAAAAEAVGFCRAALVVQPQNPIVYRHLGSALHNQKNDQQAVTEAEAAFLKAIALKPDYSNAFIGLGAVRRREGKVPEAVASFQKAIALKPNNAWAYQNLGITLSRSGKYLEGAAADRKALELAIMQQVRDEHLAILYSNVGVDLRNQNKLLEAEAAYQKAIELDPNYAHAYFNLGFAFREQNKWAEAVKAYQKAITLDPNNSEAYNDLAISHKQLNNLPEAENACRQGIVCNPQDFACYNTLGNVLKDFGRLPEAIEAYQKAIALHPDHPIPYNNLAIALTALQKLPEAEAACRKAVKLDPNYADGFNTLGFVLARQQNLPEATQAFRKAIALKPDHDAAHRNLATALSRQKLYTQAVSTLAELIDLSKNETRDNYLLQAAASYAALAGDGQGDAANLDVAERARYRKQALDWLRTDIARAINQLKSNPAKEGLVVFKMMEHWQRDSDFNTVRGEEALAKLTETERREWRKRWEDVEDLRKQAIPPGFMQDWLVLSKLVAYEGEDGAEALDQKVIAGEARLRPRSGDKVEVSGKTLMWKEHQSAEPFLDFQTLYGPPSEYRIAYAVCYIHSAADRTDLALRVGSDDQALIYLNGEEVYRNTKARALKLDEDEVRPFRLRKGTNVLVFKVVNQSGPGPFGSLHFVTKDGGMPEGIAYRLTP